MTGRGMKTVVDMHQGAEHASRLLKALANRERLLILCHLAEGEKCVSELQKILQMRQPSLSQQLARLRADELVKTRRNGKEIYYRLSSEVAGRIIDLLYEAFCASSKGSGKRKGPVTKTTARSPKSAN